MSRAFVSQSISSTVLCLLAAGILATSLISTNRAASGVQDRISTLNFYWGKTVLPDHPAYAFLMARDRIVLWLASDEEEPRLRLQYGEHRYQVAHELALQHKNDLAVSTLSKSQTYVLQGVTQMQARGLSTEERKSLYAALDHSLYRMELFHQQYPALDTPMLRSLREETAQRLSSFEQL